MTGRWGGFSASLLLGAAAAAPVGFSSITPTLRLGRDRDVAELEAVPTSPALSGPAWVARIE